MFARLPKAQDILQKGEKVNKLCPGKLIILGNDIRRDRLKATDNARDRDKVPEVIQAASLMEREEMCIFNKANITLAQGAGPKESVSLTELEYLFQLDIQALLVTFKSNLRWLYQDNGVPCFPDLTWVWLAEDAEYGKKQSRL